jgi:hypothetical protein
MKKLLSTFARMPKGTLPQFVLSCVVFVAMLVGCDFHGPWEYYPEERDVYTGIYTYGYIVSGESPYICFSKVYELDETSSRDFAFYDSAHVTVKGNFGYRAMGHSSGDGEKDTTLVLWGSDENPNCFEASSSFSGIVGEKYEMEAYFEWDSAGHSAKTTYRAQATIPNAVKVKGLNVPQPDGSYEWIENDGRKTIHIKFLEFPNDMEFVKCAMDYDKSVHGVISILDYDMENSESQATTLNDMFKGFTEKDSMGYTGIALHDPLERKQNLGFTTNTRVGNYYALDTLYLMNMMLPLGRARVEFYATDDAYNDYERKVKESVNDSRIIPESNIENGMGVFSGMSKTVFDFYVDGNGVSIEHIAWRNCENTEGDNSKSWDSRGCRLYQDVACSGMDVYDDEYMYFGGTDWESLNSRAYKAYRNDKYVISKACYASNVKAAMMLDTTKWSVFLPKDISDEEKSEAYADGLKRYCVASNFQNNKIADCFDMYQQCMVSHEKNSCKEYLWNWCADRGWYMGYEQCESALVSRFHLDEQKSSVLEREVDRICEKHSDSMPMCSDWPDPS